MKSLDLKDLVVGLLAVIFISMAIGRFGALETFARKQAVAALRPWPAHPFFPKDYEKTHPMNR
jgi:hypothetical protein